MRLSTFAFLYPVEPDQLQWFADAMPGVEFLAPQRIGLPTGLERAQAAGLGWGGPSIDEVLAAGSSLEWIHQRGAGIDAITTPTLVASKVVLTNGSGNHAPNIAEHVLGLMLAFARQFAPLVRAQQERRWQPSQTQSLFELSGQTLAVLGYGSIGHALAQRAAALGMRVLGFKRSWTGDTLPPNVAAMYSGDRLDEALRESDHVVLALPLTSQTRGIISGERMARMKRGAYLYNVGRGALIDHQALLVALRNGHIAGAGLDVTDPEPLPADSPLWVEPGVLITAHSSGLTPRSYDRHRRLLLENMQRFVRSEPLLNVVDKHLGY
jgi:phosphoglycerate dehydrogenase-like enzyme